MKTAGAVLVLVCCLLNAQAAGATTRDAHEPLVILTEQGKNDTEDRAFFSSVRALSGEIGIIVSAEEVPSFLEVQDRLLAEIQNQKKPFLVAWISREDNQRTISLFDPWKNQIRTRTIDAGSSPTANAEALALILRAELLAYLNEPPAPPAPSSPPPPPPPPPPPMPPAPPRDPRWAMTAGYRFGNFLSGRGIQQGARLGIEFMATSLRVGVAYELLSSQEAAGHRATISIRRHPFFAELGYATLEHHRLRWVAGAFMAGDLASRRTSFANSPLSAQADQDFFLVSIGLRGRQELRLTRNLAVTLGAGADILLNPVEFESIKATEEERVARTARLRWAIDLGIKVSAF